MEKTFLYDSIVCTISKEVLRIDYSRFLTEEEKQQLKNILLNCRKEIIDLKK